MSAFGFDRPFVNDCSSLNMSTLHSFTYLDLRFNHLGSHDNNIVCIQREHSDCMMVWWWVDKTGNYDKKNLNTVNSERIINGMMFLVSAHQTRNIKWKKKQCHRLTIYKWWPQQSSIRARLTKATRPPIHFICVMRTKIV